MGVYTDKEKAFKHLTKINKNGYKDWQEISGSKKTLEQFCKDFCIEHEPMYNCYSMYEIEVKE